jgi:hypothetical protein
MEMVKIVTGTILSGGKIRKMGVSTFPTGWLSTFSPSGIYRKDVTPPRINLAHAPGFKCRASLEISVTCNIITEGVHLLVR